MTLVEVSTVNEQIDIAVSSFITEINTAAVFIPDGALTIILIGAIVGALGIVVNGWALVIIFRYTDISKKINFYLLINQIAIDFAACLMIAAQFFSILDGDPAVKMFGKKVTNDALCRWWYTKAFMWAAINSSNCNIVLLTFERYLKILHPLIYNRWLTEVNVNFFYHIEQIPHD